MSEHSFRREELASGVVRLTLTDADTRGAVTTAFVEEVVRTVDGPRPAAALILASDVPGIFSSGGDRRLGSAGLHRLSDQLYRLYQTCLLSPTVLTAAVDGAAVGAGAQLVLCADVAIAGARFSLRPALPDTGLSSCIWLLTGLIGRSRTVELMLSGASIGPEQAQELRLVSGFAEDPLQRATTLALTYAEVSESMRKRVKLTALAASCLGAGLQTEMVSFQPPSP